MGLGNKDSHIFLYYIYDANRAYFEEAFRANYRKKKS